MMLFAGQREVGWSRMVGVNPISSMQTHILTVSQFTSRLKALLEGSFPDVWIEGEVSNLSLPQSGHAYFTLKDEQSQVRAVLFRSSQRFLKFTLQHGMHVVCRGRVGVYEPRGEYQLILEYIEPKGASAPFSSPSSN